MSTALLAWRDRCETQYDEAFRLHYDRLEDAGGTSGDNIVLASEIAREHVLATVPSDCAHCDSEPLDHYELALGHEWESRGPS